MGLVLAAPGDVLVPLMETSGTAPAQATTPADGVFANLLASLSAMLEANTTEPLTGSPVLPAAEPSLDREAEKSESDLFPVLMGVAVSLPVVPLPMAASAPERALDRGAGSKNAAVILASASARQSIEATPSMVSADSPEPAAALIGAITSGSPHADGATAGSAAVESAPIESVSPVHQERSATQPAPEYVHPSGAVAIAAVQSMATERTLPPTEADPDVGPMPTTLADGAHQSGTNAAGNSTSVVRSVGNAESGDNPTHDDNGNGPKADVDRPLPRASAQGIAHAADGSAVAQFRNPTETADAEALSPLPTDNVTVADTPPQVEQVAQTVIESIENGGGEARIHLDPAGMGEVTIHVRADGEHVRVEVRAERQEAMELLRDHTQDLSSLLGQRGLNLSDVNVGLGRGNSDQTWGREDGSRRDPSGNEFASILGIGEPAPLDTHNRLRTAYNPDGALVYRV